MFTINGAGDLARWKMYKEKKKNYTSLSSGSDRSRKYSMDVTKPSLFHLSKACRADRQKGGKSFKMLQSMKDCELKGIDTF